MCLFVDCAWIPNDAQDVRQRSDEEPKRVEPPLKPMQTLLWPWVCVAWHHSIPSQADDGEYKRLGQSAIACVDTCWTHKHTVVSVVSGESGGSQEQIRGTSAVQPKNTTSLIWAVGQSTWCAGIPLYIRVCLGSFVAIKVRITLDSYWQYSKGAPPCRSEWRWRLYILQQEQFDICVLRTYGYRRKQHIKTHNKMVKGTKMQWDQSYKLQRFYTNVE